MLRQGSLATFISTRTFNVTKKNSAETELYRRKDNTMLWDHAKPELGKILKPQPRFHNHVLEVQGIVNKLLIKNGEHDQRRDRKWA